MSAQDLEKPLIDSGIRSVNFFNGRLLTAKDLRREQEARHTADRWLGQAVGDGVAYGLEVKKHAQSTAQEPLVTVEGGLAVNRDGQALRLRSQTTVALVRKSKLAAVDDASFARCGNLQTGTYIAGPGVYLLTIAPARAQEGKAPTTGFDPFGGKCNTDAIVETVQLRLISLETQLADVDFTNESKLRNDVAYRCFGMKELGLSRVDPFGMEWSKYGILDSISDSVLTPCDVPLAILYWTLSGGLRFVDVWAARRPLSRVSADQWTSLVDERRPAVGYAMFMQFERQIMELATPSGDLGTITARGDFRFLPPVGVIPVAEETNQTDANATRFFRDMTYRGPAFINAARLEGLVRESMCYPPIDPQDKEVIWLYRARENRMAIDFAASGKRPRSYLVFSSGHLPYRADAQFDLGYWNYGNYALAR